MREPKVSDLMRSRVSQSSSHQSGQSVSLTTGTGTVSACLPWSVAATRSLVSRSRSERLGDDDSTRLTRLDSTDSAPPLFASIKTTCQPRREGLLSRVLVQDSSPFNIDEQAVEPGTTEYISSLSDTPSSLRHLRRGNDGQSFLSVHAETSRLFDFIMTPTIATKTTTTPSSSYVAGLVLRSVVGQQSHQ
jgi:hypothetical protein